MKLSISSFRHEVYLARAAMFWLFFASSLWTETPAQSFWKRTNWPNARSVFSLALDARGQIIAGADSGWALFSFGNGEHWSPVHIGAGDNLIWSLAVIAQNHIFAGTLGSGLFHSRDDGKTWQPIRDFPHAHVRALATNNIKGHIWAGTQGGGAFFSADTGQSWELIFEGLTNGFVHDLLINETNGFVFAGTNGGGIFRCHDEDKKWQAVNNGLSNRSIRAFAIQLQNRKYILAGTQDGIFRSYDDGENWVRIDSGFSHTDIRSLYISQGNPSHIFAGTDGGGIFRSTDNGKRWQALGLTNHSVLALISDFDGYIFAGANAQGVFLSGDPFPPKIISSSPAAPQLFRQSFLVEAEITDTTGVKNAVLRYRQGGDAVFASLNPALRLGKKYQFFVPASAVTTRGVEYYIAAEDNFDTPARFPFSGYYSVQVRINDQGETQRDNLGNSVAQPNGGEQSAYRLFSMPLDLDNKNPRAILEDDLGAYNKKKWRFYELQANQPGQPYAEIPDTSKMAPGKAFWLIVKEAGQIIDTGPGVSNPTEKEFAIPLYPKWNFIANPFNFPIMVDKLRLKSNGQSPILRSYQGSWSPISTQITVFEPFEGYAVDNKLNIVDTLFVDPDLSPLSGSLSKSFYSTLDKNILWSIRILAQSQDARDEDNVAAIVPSASQNWDELDQPEPPVIGDYVSVYFSHRDWQTLAKAFCIDARPDPAGAGEIWEFEVKTNIRDKVNLTFEGIDEVPPELEVWLVDDALKITQNLRETNHYVVAGSEQPKQLKLVVGKHDFVGEKLAGAQLIPTSYELSQNFPNPFNPATTIRYGLPQAERVTLKIYNLLGEEVALIMNDELRAAGYHAAIWDGRDKNGKVVASGVYVYRLQAGSSVIMTKKLALIK